MRVRAFLFFAAILLIYIEGSAQSVSIRGKDLTLRQVFTAIERQTGYVLLNQKGLFSNTQKLSLNIQNQPLTAALDLILKDQPFVYIIEGKTIVLKKKNAAGLVEETSSNPSVAVPVKMRVTDAGGRALSGASVSVKNKTVVGVTDAEGEVDLKISVGDIVTISYIGFESKQVKLTSESNFTVALKPAATNLETVEVSVNTGYQKISKERSTGSYTVINNQLFNRSNEANVLKRLEGIASGLMFPKTTSTEMGNQPLITIRGKSTIFGNAEPLIIVDDFPYEGDINNINAYDIETISVLKDGVAASIWGAKSGNGVIVIATKQGRSGTPKVSVDASIVVGEKPDLYYVPRISSADFIEVEKFLYEKGAFNSRILTRYQAISPVVEILEQIKQNPSYKEEGMKQIEALAGIDGREQLNKYFYQPSLQQQYSVNIGQSVKDLNYYISYGHNKNADNQVGNVWDRNTLNMKLSNSFLNRKLKVHANVVFTSQQQKRSNNINIAYPYELLADESGKPLETVGSFRKGYIDTAGNGKLLDWGFRPLQELHLKGVQNNSIEYRMNAGADYALTPYLKASIKYQFGKLNSNNKTMYAEDSYFSRNVINTFSKYDPVSKTMIRQIPEGEQIRSHLGEGTYNFIRGQVSFDKKFNNIHDVSALAAIERSENYVEQQNIERYGYHPETAISATVDYINSLTRYYGGTQRLSNGNSQGWSRDRYQSYLINLSYSYANKYIVYASARRDESNLFGVTTNQKGVPLWSLGTAWNIHEARFFKSALVSTLKLRASYGVQGNVDKSVSALLTTTSAIQSAYLSTTAMVKNPPNPSLSWEKVKSWNAGLDLALKNNLLEVQIDVYKKSGIDLIANSPIAHQTGIAQFRGNTANVQINGVDLVVTANIGKQAFRWSPALLYNYVKDEVTKYKIKQASNFNYMTGNYLNPFEGKPQTALFSYLYAGLDENGNPMGYIDKESSTDYTKIMQLQGLDNMMYHGPRTPMQFGSFRNDFKYKNLFLSFNISYQLNYYFRRESLKNGDIYSATPSYKSVIDYDKRWQKAGDEKFTNVPALIYPGVSNRNNMYLYSNVLIEKADHIRLRDLQIGIDLNRKHAAQFFYFPNNLRLIFTVSNIGILWRANKHGIDPDVFQSSYPVPRNYALRAVLDL